MPLTNISYPPIVNEYWYSIDWDVEAIWALDLPSDAFPLSKLAWHLEVPIWPFKGQNYAISPNQVLADRQKFNVEWQRIVTADLAFPIDVVRYKHRWMILDGIHRLAKASATGVPQIEARVVPVSAVRQL